MGAEAPGPSLQALLPHHPGLVAAGGGEEALEAVLDRFAVDGRDPRRAGRIYVVDPEGRLVLWYRPGAPPDGLLKDLRRLLRASRIG